MVLDLVYRWGFKLLEKEGFSSFETDEDVAQLLHVALIDLNDDLSPYKLVVQGVKRLAAHDLDFHLGRVFHLKFSGISFPCF